MFAMLLDHIGVAFLESNSYLYLIFRLIGRISFPIFCFLLIEGYTYTSNFKKYALSLAGFALISEIPYNLAFYNCLFFSEHQNVFFTLLIGLCVIKANACIAEKTKSRILSAIPIIVGCVLAYFIKCDYNISGILYITVLFFLKDYKIARNIMFGLTVPLMIYLSIKPDVASLLEAIPLVITSAQLWAIFALIPISFYNGQRGKIRISKYVFYLFYPVHLLILYGVSILINFI